MIGADTRDLMLALNNVFESSTEVAEMLDMESRFRTQAVLHRQDRIRHPILKAIAVIHAVNDGDCTQCRVKFPCPTVQLIDQHDHRDEGLAGSR